MPKYSSFLATVLIVATAQFTAAQNQNKERFEKVSGIKTADAEAFFKRLQSAVEVNDKEAFSRLVQYPIKIGQPPKRVTFKNATDLQGKYDEIVEGRVREAVLKQQFDDLFVNAQGVMIGNGQIWFSSICADKTCAKSVIKVTAINTEESK